MLISLYDDKNRESSDVKAIAASKIVEVDRKIAELKSLRTTLSSLVVHCHGDARPECPIIDELSGSE
jgi:MerR family copper efflux transcriptional regulator